MRQRERAITTARVNSCRAVCSADREIPASALFRRAQVGSRTLDRDLSAPSIRAATPHPPKASVTATISSWRPPDKIDEQRIGERQRSECAAITQQISVRAGEERLPVEKHGGVIAIAEREPDALRPRGAQHRLCEHGVAATVVCATRMAGTRARCCAMLTMPEDSAGTSIHDSPSGNRSVEMPSVANDWLSDQCETTPAPTVAG